MSKKSLGSVESLIATAWKRTRERFLSFFLAYLITIVLFFGVGLFGVIALLLAGVLSSFIGSSVPLLGSILQAGATITFFAGILYVTSWSSLATITTIINPQKIGVIEAFKKVKSIAPRFMWVQLIMGIFLIGLIPVSIALLFIPLLLWYVWLAFVPFVYLEQQKSGLMNIWISRAMISQNFWGVFGRLVLLFAAVMFFTFIFASSRSGTLIVLWQIINILLVGPFVLSFSYELYSQLDKKTMAPPPRFWIGASIVGFVIIILGAEFMVNRLSQVAPQIMNQQIQRQLDQKYQQDLENPLLNNDKVRPAKIDWNL